IRHNLGLDKPWYVQYFYWIYNVVAHHDFGFSFIDGRPVTVKILEKLPVTAELIAISFTCTLLIAIPVAIYSATHKNSLLDYLATVIVFAGYGMPTFWLGLMLLEIFSVQLRWFPASGLTTLGVGGLDLADRVRHLILPVATLTLVSLAAWIRYRRAALVAAL